jgi:retinoblastoma-like protein 1
VYVDLFLNRSCSCDPEEKLKGWVREMGYSFRTHYTQPTGDQRGKLMDFARRWLQLGEGLYFKLLEKILLNEREKRPDSDLTVLT